MISCIVFNYSNLVGSLSFYTEKKFSSEFEALQDLSFQLYENFKVLSSWEKPRECCVNTQKILSGAFYCATCGDGLKKIDFYDFVEWIKGLIDTNPDWLEGIIKNWKVKDALKNIAFIPPSQILFISNSYQLLPLFFLNFDNVEDELNLNYVIEYEECKKLYENYSSFEDYLKTLRLVRS